MNPQLQSQLFGITLATTIAIGLMAYEYLVKSCSYFTVGLIVALSFVPFFSTAPFWQAVSVRQDVQSLWQHKWIVAVYIASGVTGPLWVSDNPQAERYGCRHLRVQIHHHCRRALRLCRPEQIHLEHGYRYRFGASQRLFRLQSLKSVL